MAYLYILRFISEVMAYIYQDLYDKRWLIYIKIYMKSDGLYISRFIWPLMAYIYIYIKIYMTSDGLYISRFIWQVMAYIYQDLYDKWWLIYIKG